LCKLPNSFCIVNIKLLSKIALLKSLPEKGAIYLVCCICLEQLILNNKLIVIIVDMTEKKDYKIMVKRDGKYYVGYCLEIPQARGQGDTKSQAIEDTKKAIKICRAYLNKKITSSNVITVSV